jgi:hypothetical protein
MLIPDDHSPGERAMLASVLRTAIEGATSLRAPLKGRGGDGTRSSLTTGGDVARNPGLAFQTACPAAGLDAVAVLLDLGAAVADASRPIAVMRPKGRPLAPPAHNCRSFRS